MLEQSEITDTEHFVAEDQLWAFLNLLDHIIFNRTGYFSFLEEGKL